MKKTSTMARTLYPWLVWTMGALFFFYKYLVQVSPSVMTNDLMREFQINGAGLGNLSAFYFYAYLLMQIPVGIFLDKYSPRLLTSSAILVCCISAYIFSQTSSLTIACLARAMMGAGAAFAAVSCFKLATLWFSAKRFAFISGLCMTMAMLGAVGGQVPLSLLVESTGWRFALQQVSLIGLILSISYFLIVRDKKTVYKSDNPNEGFLIGDSLKSVLHHKQTWLLSLYSGLAFAPVSVFGGLWGVPFLKTAYRLTANNAAFAVSWIFIGFAIGAPFFGWLSDFMGKRKPILFVGTFTALICISTVLYYPSDSLFFCSFLLCLFGFGASGFFTSFAMIRELFPLLLGGTVLGIMNTFDSICEALFEPAVGFALDAFWQGSIIDGVHYFSLNSYRAALSLLPLSLLFSLLILSFIKETYCQPIDTASQEKKH